MDRRELLGGIVSLLLGKAETCVVTAYCPCGVCCGKWSVEHGGPGLTASGHRPIEGNTVAVDPRVYPLGTLLSIEGLGLRLASDTGGDIKGNRLDVFFNDHKEAKKFGRRTLSVRVFKGAKKS